MKLLGIEFGAVANAAGARNFFGEGWPHHRALGPFRPRFAGATFVAKTTTVEPRLGNLPLDGTTPRDWFPACIKVNLRRAAVLNAVGLSGPGLDVLLVDGRWRSRPDPFFLSFMAVEADPDLRVGKAIAFATAVAAERPRFRAPFGVQVNFSCPNVGVDHGDLGAEVRRTLTELAARLPGVPLVPKLNATVAVAAARDLATHPACAAVCVSNTIPWGSVPDRIDWRGLYGEVSPLARFGGGGLSGAPIFPLVRDWVEAAARRQFPVPIVAGGGIMAADDAVALLRAGAAAVELGSVAIVRPWRVAGIIRAVDRYLWRD